MISVGLIIRGFCAAIAICIFIMGMVASGLYSDNRTMNFDAAMFGIFMLIVIWELTK